MKSFGNAVRLTLCCCVLLLVWSAAIPGAHAQTVTVSPSDLSFGVPTGTPSPFQSAADNVTVNITGAGSVSFTAANTSGTNSADFKITGNSCTGTLTAPTTCQVTVTFTASLAPATTLETATLNINYGDGATISVPMNGGFGAIKLFSSINVNNSLFSGVTWPESAGNPVKTTTINLSCPANPTALLSSTPGTTSTIVNDVQQNVYANVFQDNTIEVQNTPAGGHTATTTNVCYGGDPTFEGFTGFPSGTSNCFQQAYESAVSGFVGQNPDLASGLLTNYGVQPLDLQNSTSLFPPVLQSGLQSFFVELSDAGGFLGASTLHLITNCSITGITPGGTITGNPINTNDPSTETQTFAFDNTGGQNISLTTSYSAGISAGTVSIPNGTVQRTVDIGIPQQLFSQLVANSSAAPSVCLRLTGEKDSFGNPMCKGFLVQCSLNGGSFTGDNCVPTNSTVRNLFDSAKFSSPDAPDNGTNYLGSACSFFLGGTGACASTNLATPTLIGPGILLGSDNWVCASGQGNPCTPLEPDTHTATSPATYSSANCVLTGGIAGDLCPLDTLTFFAGESDPTHGSTTTGKNSVFIPVVNMPLPYTVASVTNANASGWVNTGTASASFQSKAANYPTTAGTPAPNGFAPAPPYSVTYGISLAGSAVPDTTYPVPGDKSQFNTNTNPNFGTPLCQAGTPAMSPVFGDSFSPGDGIYNLHYFTTDCALTEELLFNPTAAQLTDPAANWASFRTIAFGIDTLAPQVSSCNSPSTSVWYNTNQTVSCTVTDQNYVAGVSASGFLPLTNGIQGSQSEVVTATTNVAANTVNAAAAGTPTQACDLAGNCVNIPAGPFMIDRVAPTIAGPTLAPAAAGNVYFVGGPAVTITYTCSDGAAPNSGIASCSGPVPSGGAIDTSGAAIGPHTFTVTARDNAGNQTQVSVNYNVAYASADLAIAASNLTEAEAGGKVVYGFIASDLGPKTGLGVTITDTLPAGLTFVSGSFTNGVTAGKCSNVSGTVTCTIGSVPVVPARGSIYVGQITATVTAKAGTTISNTINISGLNPDPNSGNNSSTVKVKVSN
jgi:uncharacterized repeat protein (TIGR01451 family)